LGGFYWGFFFFFEKAGLGKPRKTRGGAFLRGDLFSGAETGPFFFSPPARLLGWGTGGPQKNGGAGNGGLLIFSSSPPEGPLFRDLPNRDFPRAGCWVAPMGKPPPKKIWASIIPGGGPLFSKKKKAYLGFFGRKSFLPRGAAGGVRGSPCCKEPCVVGCVTHRCDFLFVWQNFFSPGGKKNPGGFRALRLHVAGGQKGGRLPERDGPRFLSKKAEKAAGKGRRPPFQRAGRFVFAHTAPFCRVFAQTRPPAV